MANFEFRDDSHGIGTVMILHSSWKPDFEKILREKNIEAIRLSYSMGFRDRDVGFISRLTFLRSLEIYTWDVTSVNVSNLNKLEVLGFEIQCKTRVDFSKLNKLRVAFLRWRKGFEGIFRVGTLEELNVVNYPYEDLIPLKGLKKLRKLHITSRKLASLNGITALKRLRELDLYNCPQLSSLSGVDKCPQRIEIEVEACRHISRSTMKTHNKALSSDA
jgi:hypothetical protein